MATRKQADNELLLKGGMALGGLMLVSEVLTRLFPPPPDPGSGPGGDVDPADPGDADPRPATFTVAYARALADQIEVAIWNTLGLPWENDTAVANALMQAQTLKDVSMLINAFGERGTWWQSDLRLPAAVTAYLDNDLKNAVNADYEMKDIPFQW